MQEKPIKEKLLNSLKHTIRISCICFIFISAIKHPWVFVLQYVSNKTLPAWVMVNNTLERLMNLTDVYPSAAFPPPVAYLKGGKISLHTLSVEVSLIHSGNVNLDCESIKISWLWEHQDILTVRTPRYLDCENTKISWLWEHQDILTVRTSRYLACENTKISCLWEHQDILTERTPRYLVCENTKISWLWEHQDILTVRTPRYLDCENTKIWEELIRHIATVMFLSFRTVRSGQTVQTQIRLLLGAVWSGSTPFAIPSSSFGCITLKKRHLVHFLGWLHVLKGLLTACRYGSFPFGTAHIWASSHLWLGKIGL